jgi:DTW domain-containing protein YfiP
MAPLDLATKLCLVMHWREIAKTTNSGKVAARCLVGSKILEHGRRDRPLERPDFGTTTPVLLFPSDNATPLAEVKGPVTLIVPDGTWTQAIRMGRRIPWMAELPRVALPEHDGKTTYLLRSSERSGGLGTMEAIARAFGVLEGPAVQAKLDHIFKLFVERTLAARGQQHRIAR